jgi:hypothetical protein
MTKNLKGKIQKILKSGASHYSKIWDLAELLPSDQARRLCACDYADRAVTRAASDGVSLSDCVAGARRIAEGRATEAERRKFYATTATAATTAAAATATAATATATATAAAATAAATFYLYGFHWSFDFATDDPGILAERQWQLDHIVELLEAQEVQP